MILLAKSFLRHYFFAVVQTASKPHPTRGQTTLTARTMTPHPAPRTLMESEMRKPALCSSQSIVSYSTKSYKAVSVPMGKPVLIKDIAQWKTGKKPVARTELRLWRDTANLYLHVSCLEPKPELIRTENKQDGMGVWKGDLIEIFFGAIEPVPWLLQLAVGAGGGRFDSRGLYDQWEAKTSHDSAGWHAEIRIPMSFLRLNNLSTGFNLCRQNLARQEYSSWANLETKFHEPENFADLLFCDYDEAFFAKTGCLPEKRLTRTSFEKEIALRFVPAESVVHGPYLSNPSPDGMTVSWATAGMSGAMLEYRKKGTQEWLLHPVNHQSGILQQNSRMHIAHLTGLEENTVYEYRLINLTPLLNKRNLTPAEEPLAFRTMTTKAKEFSFAACSDIHSNTLILKKLMELPEVQQTTFFVNLGDMLSSMAGPAALFEGFLDLQTELYAKEKPLVFVRGNHEQIGTFAADYFQLMPHPSGRTYYAFRHGKVCFLALDTGNDHPDDAAGIHRNTAMIAEERKWLQEVVQSKLFREASFRVAFLHMPLYSDKYDSQAGISLLDGMFEDAPLHLLISGHVHRYFRINPFSGECTAGEKKLQIQNTPILPFTVIANNTNTTVLVKVTPTALQVQILDTTGKIVDKLSILPNAQIAD